MRAPNWIACAILALACPVAVACSSEEPALAGPGTDAGGGATGDSGAPADGGPNAAPLADAGADQLGAVALAVRLDGRASSDPDGDALDFQWTWVSRPGGSSAALLSADSSRPSFVPDVAGEYVAELVVNDGKLESTDKARVEVRSTGKFVPFFGGSGDILDVASGETISVPLERRIHLWVLPEGYLKSDLTQFDSDVAAWWQDVLAIDVYAAFKQAFVVWKLPVASAEHVSLTTPQSASTAFAIPLSSTGSVSPSIPPNGPTAERLWSYMAEFPFAASEFLSGRRRNGLASQRARRSNPDLRSAQRAVRLLGRVAQAGKPGQS